jgi:hypothetical protein
VVDEAISNKTSSTATAGPQGAPAAEQGADRAARGVPVARAAGGVPVYASGDAPAFLRTTSQLEQERRKPAPGQAPAAYVITRWYRDEVALFDPGRAVRMRPLSALQRRQMHQRRTCTACGEVFPQPVWGACGPCRRREDEQRADLARRTCRDCGTVFNTPAPAGGWYGGQCLACEARLQQGRQVARSLEARACSRCTIQVVPLAQWAAMEPWQRNLAELDDRYCPPCRQDLAREREQAQRRADRARWDELGPVVAWAKEILADPEGFAIVDSETTGLHSTARIVELAVTTAAGTVLLNSLLNPGEPIPSEATAIHGITDAMVTGAPTFSEILPQLTAALSGRRIVIYNRDYDTGRLCWELHLHHLLRPAVDLTKYGLRTHPAATAWMDAQRWDECAMEQYAVFHGDWHDYWRSYTWQPLGGGHRALGDCRAVIERIKEVAARPDPFTGPSES